MTWKTRKFIVCQPHHYSPSHHHHGKEYLCRNKHCGCEAFLTIDKLDSTTIVAAMRTQCTANNDNDSDSDNNEMQLKTPANFLDTRVMSNTSTNISPTAKNNGNGSGLR